MHSHTLPSSSSSSATSSSTTSSLSPPSREEEIKNVPHKRKAHGDDPKEDVGKKSRGGAWDTENQLPATASNPESSKSDVAPATSFSSTASLEVVAGVEEAGPPPPRPLPSTAQTSVSRMAEDLNWMGVGLPVVPAASLSTASMAQQPSLRDLAEHPQASAPGAAAAASTGSLTAMALLAAPTQRPSSSTAEDKKPATSSSSAFSLK